MNALSINASNISIITGVVLPIIVGMFVNPLHNVKVKVILSMFINAGAALLVNAINEQGIAVISTAMLSNFVQQFAVATAVYLGVFKNIDLNAKLPTIPLPGIGVSNNKE